MIGENLERLRAHRNNVRRYRKLLATRLSDIERAYIERRLGDEQASLDALLQEMFPDRLSGRLANATTAGRTTNLEINALLHPADAFIHPMDVVEDCDLTSYEKRAILSSWAVDACAATVEPGQSFHGAAASFDDVVDALRVLESEPEPTADLGPESGRHSGAQNSGDTASL